MNDLPKSDNGNNVEVMKDKESQDKEIVLARAIFPPQLPVIPLNNRPLFPKMMVPMLIEADNLKMLLADRAQSDSKYVGLFLLKNRQEGVDQNTVKVSDLCSVGVVAEILQIVQVSSDAPVQVLFNIHERCRIDSIVREEPYILAKVTYLVETEMAANEELKAYSVSVIRSIKELIQLNPLHKEELSIFMTRSNINEPGRLADIAVALTTADGKEQQDILEALSIRTRLRKVLILLKRELEISKMQQKISKQIEEKLSKQQRQFFLQEHH